MASKGIHFWDINGTWEIELSWWSIHLMDVNGWLMEYVNGTCILKKYEWNIKLILMGYLMGYEWTVNGLLIEQ